MPAVARLLFVSLSSALGLLLLYSCNTSHQSVFFSAPAYTAPPGKRTGALGPCNLWKNYLPDSSLPALFPPRQIRVNFHVMNSRDSSHNYPPDKAREVLSELLRCANADLDTNAHNWRSPEGTAVLPKGYRYVLWPQAGDDGFYFHYDDSLYYFISQGKQINNYSRKVIDTYTVGKDSILNMFLLVHHPDSVKSPTYRATRQGIALGTSFKIAGLYESTDPPCGSSGLLNHEIGHILTLMHAWSEDGCPDTDNHPNKCWVRTETPPCRDQATNNMMDYNAYQLALTPCQIGRIQACFANEQHAIRKCLVPDWCTPQPGCDLLIRDSVAWAGARDIRGNITIASGGILYLSCRVSMPEGSRIEVQPGAKLYLDGARLHNSCNKNWQGIRLLQKKGQQGKVILLQPSRIENTNNTDSPPPGRQRIKGTR
jgi:hypothetical protein